MENLSVPYNGLSVKGRDMPSIIRSDSNRLSPSASLLTRITWISEMQMLQKRKGIARILEPLRKIHPDAPVTFLLKLSNLAKCMFKVKRQCDIFIVLFFLPILISSIINQVPL